MKSRTLSNNRIRKFDESLQMRLSGVRFYGDEFVLNTATGMFFRLSPSAVFILKQLAAGTQADKLITVLREYYKIDKKTAIRDVELLMNELVMLGLVNVGAK